MMFCCMRWHTCGGNTGNGSIRARISLNVVLCVGGLTDGPPIASRKRAQVNVRPRLFVNANNRKNLRKREMKHNMTLA